MATMTLKDLEGILKTINDHADIQDDDFWVEPHHQYKMDGEYDINLFVYEDGRRTATVYPVKNNNTLTNQVLLHLELPRPKYNHVVNVSFDVKTNNHEGDTSYEEMIRGLEKRLNYLKNNPDPDAFVICDSYEN